jgi:CubicO group peptidase (beta-lactamase class C family)
MIRRRETLIGLGTAGLAGPAVAGGGSAPPFRKDGLAELEAMLQAHVAKGSAPGLVALVARHGETHAWPLGAMSLEPGAPPVPRDAIFRIASMTKPVTAAVAMMLVEEGKLRLDEPVERLLPELAGRRVLARIDAPLNETVPAKRPMTLEDVMSFRLGWGIMFADPPPPIQIATAKLEGFGMPDPTRPLTPDAWLGELSKLPLMAQPGERWMYTTGSDVLGVMIARAEGKPLPEVFEARVLAPLGMKDTGFFVPPEKLDRFVTGYFPQGGKLTLFDPPSGLYAKPPVFPAGDSGLVSTADDYALFARFMRTGLAPDGRRLLSERSLKTMTTDHLTAEQRDGGKEILGPGRGWGYGMAVTVGANPDGRRPGAYGWEGGFGTSWFNDPASGLTAILLTQRVFDSADPPPLIKGFWRAAIAAIA